MLARLVQGSLRIPVVGDSSGSERTRKRPDMQQLEQIWKEKSLGTAAVLVPLPYGGTQRPVSAFQALTPLATAPNIQGTGAA